MNGFDLQYILLAQYPALLILALLFLIGFFRARKRSAFRSFLCMLLFSLSLAADIVCIVWGMHEKYWTLTSFVQLPVWSWLGLVLVLLLLALRLWHAAESAHHRRKLSRAMEKAEKVKEDEVRRAREEGAAQERAKAAEESIRPDDEAAPEAVTQKESAPAAEQAKPAAQEQAAGDGPSRSQPPEPPMPLEV